ncbi:Asp-tRNA(Asn)/Glu-tRNA(Gln) amidotransferase subunit GatC [Prochlorococcus sp. MIT 1223]|uniref:Asp-tRNA(Asn)/Glu-tRNA(Gln) amidotransferase subunit GatC n=1 Tax=Prochlorococcus sp. MIT 1223 TaxID=3096217 RepID=UPI002A755CD5|nr:Asp-tRNA(Asn)/Glu-tRNA(Gln) amidotransferase subunit GatC [Prochlorococcus sp. MIT 1223]
MTNISSDDVRKVAQLARIDLKDEEIDIYSQQLESILGYIEQLERIDTNDVQPTTRAVEVVNVLRKDIVEPTQVREELIDLAPCREADYFRVPQILSD